MMYKRYTIDVPHGETSIGLFNTITLVYKYFHILEFSGSHVFLSSRDSTNEWPVTSIVFKCSISQKF